MDRPISSGYGETNASEANVTGGKRAEICPHCGQSINRGVEQFLGKLGMSNETIDNIKSSLQNVDVEEYLNTARDYVRSNSEKAKSFTKDNPGKVAAGIAVLAVGAGLLISALRRD